MSFRSFPKSIQALIALMFFSALLHMLILAVYFVMTHDSVPLNFFSIIGLSLFFPELATSQFSSLASVLLTVGIYCSFYYYFSHDRRRTR